MLCLIIFRDISGGPRGVKSILFVKQEVVPVDVIDTFLVDDSLNMLMTLKMMMGWYCYRDKHSADFLQYRHTHSQNLKNIFPASNA